MIGAFFARRVRTFAVGSVVVGGLLSATAVGGIGEQVLTIQASNQQGSASYILNLNDTGWDYRNDPHGEYTWTLNKAVTLTDSSNGATIAKVSDLSIYLRNDPQINLQLAVQAGDSETSFTIMSGKLEFDSITHSAGTASSAFTLTDANNNGAYVNGTTGPSSSAAYWAAFNGDTPDAETFSEMLASIKVNPGESSRSWAGSDPTEGGYRSIDAEVHDMSSAVQFNLSAFDLLSGTTNFEIVPEPAGILLLAVAALAARRSLR